MVERKKPLLCKQCRLFDKKHKVCAVTVMHAGKKLELKVKPNDECHWEALGIEVQEIRAWSDGKDGHVEMTDGNIEMVEKE